MTALNDAERTASAMLKQAEHAEQKAAHEASFTQHVLATTAARKKTGT